MLAAGQYGAMSFAAHPHRIDHSMGSLPILCPCKDADIPPIRQSFSPAFGPVFFAHVTGAYVLGDGCQRPPSVIPAHPRASGTGMTENTRRHNKRRSAQRISFRTTRQVLPSVLDVSFQGGIHWGRRCVGLHPPLSCRTSPHQGGRSASGTIAASFSSSRWARPCRRSISPLEGEMSGRTEGGKAPRTLDPLSMDNLLKTHT